MLFARNPIILHEVNYIIMMKKIYVTRRIDETGINLLRKKYNVFMSFKHTSPSKKEILKRVKNVDAIICTLSERIDSDVMDAAGDTRVTGLLGTGYEHIDVDEATKRGIYVTNTGEYYLRLQQI